MASQKTTTESPQPPPPSPSSNNNNEPPTDSPPSENNNNNEGPQKISQVYSYLTHLVESSNNKAKWGDKQTVVSTHSSNITDDNDDDDEESSSKSQSEAKSSNEVELIDDAEGIPPSPHVRTLSGIPYGTESSKQSLDLYYPGSYISRHLDPEKDVEKEGEEEEEEAEFENKTSLLPVFIHIHGGGWSRGDKSNSFYGAPSVCRTMSSTGCLSIAIGYRLGAYPHFMEDTSLAIKWVYDRVYQLGGDKNNMFLGGHSAGGHIASLLMVRHDSFLRPHGIPTDFIRGMVLLSGVYDLFDPLKKAPIDVKNKWFYAAYVLPAFGRDEALRYENSPLLLLDPDAKKHVSTVNLRENIQHKVHHAPAIVALPPAPALPAVSPPTLEGVKEVAKLPIGPVVKLKKKLSAEEEQEKKDDNDVSGGGGGGKEGDTKSKSDTRDESTNISTKEKNKSAKSTNEKKEIQKSQKVIVNTALPPTLIINATYDMGLEENGALMTKAMEKYTGVKYVRVKGTDHASICWDCKAAEEMVEFVKKHYCKPTKEELEGAYEVVEDDVFWSCRSISVS